MTNIFQYEVNANDKKTLKINLSNNLFNMKWMQYQKRKWCKKFIEKMNEITLSELMFGVKVQLFWWGHTNAIFPVVWTFKVCLVKKVTTFWNGHFMIISGHFISNCIDIFHKTKVLRVIFRSLFDQKLRHKSEMFLATEFFNFGRKKPES